MREEEEDLTASRLPSGRSRQRSPQSWQETACRFATNLCMAPPCLDEVWPARETLDRTG